jgi:hypothetical protein
LSPPRLWDDAPASWDAAVALQERTLSVQAAFLERRIDSEHAEWVQTARLRVTSNKTGSANRGRHRPIA